MYQTDWTDQSYSYIYVYERTNEPVFTALLPNSCQQPSFFRKILKKRNETHHFPSFSLSCPQVSGPMSADFSFIFLAVPLINVTRNSRYKLICFVFIATCGIKLIWSIQFQRFIISSSLHCRIWHSFCSFFYGRVYYDY